MKKFKFRLEKVMEMRAEQVRQCQMALAEAQLAVSREQQKLVEMKTAKAKEKEAVEAKRTGERFNPREMDSHYRYIKKLENDMLRQQSRIVQVKRVEDAKRHALLQASMEKKKFENLKERQLEDHMMAIQKKELAALDDLSTTHFGKIKD